MAQIYVQTPPGPAQRARFARPPWLDGLRAGSSSRGVAGAEGAAVLDAIGGAQRHPAGTDGRQLARGEPGSHQDQPDTACCLCARRQRRQRSQQSGGVGCGAGWGAQWPVLVVVGGVLAADRPTQGRLSARVTASTSAAPAVSACGQRQRGPQRAAPVRAQPAGAGGRGDRRCGRYEPLRQVCGHKLRVGLRLLGLQKERRLRGAAGGVGVVASSSRRSRGAGRPRARATRIAEDWISELQRG